MGRVATISGSVQFGTSALFLSTISWPCGLRSAERRISYEPDLSRNPGVGHFSHRIFLACGDRPARPTYRGLSMSHISPVSETLAIEIEQLIFKHVRVQDLFDGGQTFVGTSAAADAILEAFRVAQTAKQPAAWRW